MGVPSVYRILGGVVPKLVTALGHRFEYCPRHQFGLFGLFILISLPLCGGLFR